MACLIRSLSVVILAAAAFVTTASVTTGCPPPAPPAVPDAPDAPWVFGPMKDGLQLGLRVTAGNDLAVTVRNTGTSDTCLNLGLALANGRRYLPTALRLSVETADGDRRDFAMLTPPIAGRVDDYLVPLGAGASHILLLKTSTFRSPDGVPPGPGRYTVTLTSGPPVLVNHDMLGVARLAIWSGELASGSAASR